MPNKNGSTALIWQLLLVCYCLLIYFLSDRPMLPVPMLFSWQDKVMHVVGYALLAWLFWHAWRSLFSGDRLAVATLLFCLLYGVSDEWHQSFVTGRDASAGDVVADFIGAFLLTATLWKREFRKV